MTKPKHHSFVDEDGVEYTLDLDALCRPLAERMSLDLDIPQQRCFAEVKQCVIEGRLAVDWDVKRDRIRLVPVPTAFRPQ